MIAGMGWLALIVFALGTYIAMGVVPFAASTLIGPRAGVALLMVSWAAGLAGMAILTRRRSRWAVLGPVLAFAYWLLIISIGEFLFDWTA